jgi:dCTP deaminase
LGLFSPNVRVERRTGILPSQEIRELVRNGKIRSVIDIADNQIQPASIDLRLGSIAYRVQASFLPGKSSSIETKIRDLKLAEIDLSKPALLETGAVFIVPLIESLSLPADVSGKANPKSTTGRLDIFTRLITDGGEVFEEVEKGYSGLLYAEIVSRTFPIVVQAGTKLTQLRFVRGNPTTPTDGVLERFDQRESLVYYENGDGPGKAILGRGVRLSIDLHGKSQSTPVVAYRAKRNAPAVDLSRIAAYDTVDFWETIYAPTSRRMVLNPGDFYLLASRERLSIPPMCAAEMEQFDPSIGEFSVHYAGFFDPGFGFGTAGEIKGTKAVLEVRAHEVPILLEDKQTVGRLMYHRMADVPNQLYGQAIGSSYQQQGLALPKQFRTAPSMELVATP